MERQFWQKVSTRAFFVTTLALSATACESDPTLAATEVKDNPTASKSVNPPEAQVLFAEPTPPAPVSKEFKISTTTSNLDVQARAEIVNHWLAYLFSKQESPGILFHPSLVDPGSWQRQLLRVVDNNISTDSPLTASWMLLYQAERSNFYQYQTEGSKDLERQRGEVQFNRIQIKETTFNLSPADVDNKITRRSILSIFYTRKVHLRTEKTQYHVSDADAIGKWANEPLSLPEEWSPFKEELWSGSITGKFGPKGEIIWEIKDLPVTIIKNKHSLILPSNAFKAGFDPICQSFGNRLALPYCPDSVVTGVLP